MDIKDYLSRTGITVELSIRVPGNNDLFFREKINIEPGFIEKAESLDLFSEGPINWQAGQAAQRAMNRLVNKLHKSKDHEYSKDDKEKLVNEALLKLNLKGMAYQSDGVFMIYSLCRLPYPQAVNYMPEDGIEVWPQFYTLVNVDGKESFHFTRQGGLYVKKYLPGGESDLDPQVVKDTLNGLPFPASIVCYESHDEIPEHAKMYVHDFSKDKEELD